VLKPGRTPGAVEVQLDVDDQLPLHGQVDVERPAIGQHHGQQAGRIAAL